MGDKLDLSAVLRAGFTRCFHYLTAFTFVLVVPAIPYLLVSVVMGMVMEPGIVTLSWQDSRSWLLVLLLILMLLIVLATLWVICRLLLLPTVVALHGWQGALAFTWHKRRHLTWRFIGLTVSITTIAFLIVAISARSLLQSAAVPERLAFASTLNLLNLGGSLIAAILYVGILAAHLPSDRFLNWRWSDNSWMR
jgi:hypothetical protein